MGQRPLPGVNEICILFTCLYIFVSNACYVFYVEIYTRLPDTSLYRKHLIEPYPFFLPSPPLPAGARPTAVNICPCFLYLRDLFVTFCTYPRRLRSLTYYLWRRVYRDGYKFPRRGMGFLYPLVYYKRYGYVLLGYGLILKVISAVLVVWM